MNNSIIVFAIVGVSILMAGLVIALISIRFIKTTKVSKRLQDFVVDYQQGSPIGEQPLVGSVQQVLIEEPLQGTFINRIIIPFFRRIVNFLGRFSPQQSIDSITRKISVAGINLKPIEFLGIRAFMFLLGVATVGGLYYLTKRTDAMFLFFYFAAMVFFVLAPSAWLSSRVRQAQDDIRSGLPDALDMLSVCTYAGLGFDQALQRVSDYWNTPLGNDFRRVVQEIELGVSRAEALRSMSVRLQVTELSSFVAVIIQAEVLGMPISDVLHRQAEQMRVVRQFRAKEIANRLPAKMMFPLAFLVLPALMAVIMSPIVPALMNMFGSF